MEHLRGPLHKFALSLFDVIKKQNPEGNLLFSPMTASAAVILLMSGAEGSTKDEMLAALHLKNETKFSAPATEQDIQMAYRRALSTISRAASEDDEKRRLCENPDGEDYGAFQVFRINKLFVQEGTGILEEFKEIVQKLKADIGFIDFANGPARAREEINQFIEEIMNGKIKECFPVGAITKSTQIVLANGIGFRARWQYPFDIEKTTLKPFYSAPANGKPELQTLLSKPVYTVTEVPTMQGSLGIPYFEDTELDIHYLELPYLYNAASFLIMLPKKKNGLKDLQKGLSPAGISRLNQMKRMKDVELSLPKLEIQVNLDMKTALQKIGIREVFATSANLSRITPVPGKSVSALCHSGFMSIGEKGTGAENASVTQPEGRESASGRRAVTSLSGAVLDRITAVSTEKANASKTIAIEVDHPFIFAVRHNRTGLMICLGRVETVGSISAEM